MAGTCTMLRWCILQCDAEHSKRIRLSEAHRQVF